MGRGSRARSRRALRAASAAALALASGAAIAAAGGSAEPDGAAVLIAAVKPLQSAVDRDPAALCASFTPQFAAALVPGSSQRCPQAAAAFMSAAAATDPPPVPPPHVVATDVAVEVGGNSATAQFTASYREQGGLTVLVPVRFVLRRLAGRWLVDSLVRLDLAPGCRPGLPAPCPRGAQHLVLLLPRSLGGPALITVPVPAAVGRAGEGAVGAFRAGEHYTAMSGCLACHRIGYSGNRGPGPNLTHVGARLTGREIRRALTDPAAPMPSFARTAPRKLRDMIAFLAALK